MPKRKNKPKTKQPKNQNGDPPKKRRKVNAPDEPIDLPEMKNITDVNDDCLEHILKYLPLEDLLNVADSSKSLNNGVGLAFKSKYGKYVVKLDFMRSRKRRRIDISMEEIRILDFPTCLKMLRCLGTSITKLATRSGSTYASKREYDELDRYLGEYCADTDVKLEYGRDTLEHLKKPLTKVRTVCFSNAQFHCEPADMQRCFPNLRDLTFKDSFAIESAAGQFPHLEHLDMDISGKRRTVFATCLQSNPQLRSLSISAHKVNSKFLQMLSKCPKLETLHLKNRKAIDIDLNGVPVEFKTVKKFRVDGSYLKQLDTTNISIAFDKLDELTISGQLNKNVLCFASKHPSISKFNLNGWNSWNNNNKILSYLAKALPSVTELHFQWCILSHRNVSAFIRKCKLLKLFEFHVNSRAKYDALKNLVGTEWRLSTTSIDSSFIPVKLERQI